MRGRQASTRSPIAAIIDGRLCASSLAHQTSCVAVATMPTSVATMDTTQV
jgi:hypothetical protein